MNWVIKHKRSVLFALAVFILVVLFLRQASSLNSTADERVFAIEERLLEEQISLVGTLEPAERYIITAPFEGHISELYVEQGNSVNIGDKLLSLSTKELDTRLRNAEIAYLTAQEKFGILKDWDNSQEVSKARRDFFNAQAQVKRAEKKMSETQVLYNKGIIARSELEADEETFNSQKSVVLDAKINLDSVLAQVTAQKIRIASLELKNARAAYEELMALRESATITSPITGVVQFGVRDKQTDIQSAKLILGQKIAAGYSLYLIEQSDKLNVLTHASEFDVTKLSVGQTGKLEVPGSDGELTATILKISDQAVNQEYSQSGPKVEIQATLNDWSPSSDFPLRIGGTVYLNFTSYLGSDVILIPPSALSFTSDRVLVSVVSGSGEIDERSVEIGRSLDGQIEILSGLSHGEQVRLK